MRFQSLNPGIILLSSLFILCILAHPSDARQSQGQESADISRAGIERLLQDLEDPQQLERLKQDLRILLEAGQAEPDELKIESRGLVGDLLFLASEYVQGINQMLSETGKHVLEVPALLVELSEQARDPEVLKSWGEMAGKVFLVLMAGLLAQVLVIRLLSRVRKALEDQDAYSLGFRGILMVGNTFLEIIPIAAFAAAAYGLLPFLDPRPGTQLVALTLINANVFVRLILALTRLILVPGVPSLRFLPLDNESVQYLYIWARRVARIGVYGYFTLEAALILGLPQSLYLFVLKLLGLVITLMVIILVMQNRRDVAAWIRGGPDQPEPVLPEEPVKDHTRRISAFRRRLADFWHVGAVMFAVGLFGTWVLEIQGGLYFVIRAVILTVMVLVLISFLVRLSRRGIDHLFKISDELKKDHPELEARANRYLPLLQHTVRGVLYAIAFFSIMQVWGLGTLSWLLSPQGGAVFSKLLVIFLIIAGAFLVWEVVSVKIENYLAKERLNGGKQSSTRILTLLPLLRNVVRIALFLVAGMSVLAHLGINIAPLLAGAGVIGLAVGFGAQTLVRDVITGAFILLEDSIAVGDWVEAGGYAGTVEKLSIRTVTLRDLSGAVYVIPFGDVTTVKNNNRDYGYALIDAGVAYREDYGEVVQALQDVAIELRQDEVWGPDVIGDLEVFGLNNLADSAVEIRVRLKTMPGRQFSVRRAFLERMKRIFDDRGIEIPFPHQTIWFGVDKDGSAPPMRILKEPGLEVSARAVDTGSGQDRARSEINYTSETEASQDVMEELRKAEQEDRDPQDQEEAKKNQS
ncbi:mechanosensitive ion channel family protein [Desulfonatronovibrio hydrogenovorans]|uniref:mechanosensitive ion channel family protein n=1 Tax=Desulfonatronovibrio hydrogenovorans TaxID=53245 RepID=UPI00068AE089|nr:mechanosensitive ion channel domain-containing protein [Desulfonatronovibrio hydrogenovorans]